MCLSLYPDADRFTAHQLTGKEHHTGEGFVGRLSGSGLGSASVAQTSPIRQEMTTDNALGPESPQPGTSQASQAAGSGKQRERLEEWEQREEYERMQQEIDSDDLEWEGAGGKEDDEEEWPFWGGAHELYKSPCLQEGYTEYCCLCVCGWKCPLWLLFRDYVEDKGQGPLLCLRDRPRCHGIFCGPPCRSSLPGSDQANVNYGEFDLVDVVVDENKENTQVVTHRQVPLNSDR